MWHDNVDLLAYHDLDGRSGLKLALQEVDGQFFLYVAGLWHSGWSILNVTDAEHTELLRFVDGPANTMTLQVQVADGTMITALDHPPPGLTIGDPAARGHTKPTKKRSPSMCPDGCTVQTDVATAASASEGLNHASDVMRAHPFGIKAGDRRPELSRHHLRTQQGEANACHDSRNNDRKAWIRSDCARSTQVAH